MEFNKSNITEKDFLTLLRELHVLRDENYALKDELAKEKEEKKRLVDTYRFARKAFKLCSFLVNGMNPVIAGKALELLNEFNADRAKVGLEPFNFEVKQNSSVYNLVTKLNSESNNDLNS